MRRNERALLVAALVFGAGLVAVVAAGGRRWAPTTNEQGHPRAVVIGALALTALLLGWRLVRAVRSVGGLRPRGLPRAAVVVPAALAVAALVTMTFVYLGIGHRHDRSVTAGRVGGP